MSTLSTTELSYLAEGMSCGHCRIAVTDEVSKVAGVTGVDVDLDTKLVRVHGTDIDSAAVIAAIDEAGYDAVQA
ncbi:MAG TPA: cation transporter [Solirubrobacter sp.]|nr:cation transporter [Solirubrobacter sp.]